MSLLIRLAINAVALVAAAYLVPGITLGAGRLPSTSGDFVTLLIVALIFGVVNAIIKPIITVLTLPFTILTLGLFIFVVNALMLLLTSALSDAFKLSFHVDGFVAALLGSLIISIVSTILNWFVKSEAR